MDSHSRPAVTSKPRAHSRLASLYLGRFRGILQTDDVLSQGETLPRVPVSPSDASSQPPSNASSCSNTSSETQLSDTAAPPIIRTRSAEDRPRIADAATWMEAEKEYDTYRDVDEYEKLLRRSPRTMHQTSSKLLRMTDDMRPFTRVRSTSRVSACYPRATKLPRRYDTTCLMMYILLPNSPSVVHTIFFLTICNADYTSSTSRLRGAMPRSSHSLQELTFLAGLQRSLCDAHSELAAHATSSPFLSHRPHIYQRRSRDESGLSQVFPIESNARPKGCVPDRNDDHHDHILHGQGDGTIGVQSVCRS